MSAHIPLRNVSRRFGATVALEAVDLDIAAGQFVALVGPIGWDRGNRQPQLYVLLDRVHYAQDRPVFHAQTYCVEGRNRIYTSTSR
jgi:ABC-type enterochelin transport system ATPase subunit